MTTWLVRVRARARVSYPNQLNLTLTPTPTPTQVSKYRPEWPPNLAAEMKQYAAEVAPPDVPLPPKGTPPTRGEVEF